MKSENLMIGDWVINPVHNDKCKIHGVYFDKELNCIVATDGRFPQEYFSPIRLTPEILEANGFKHKQNVSYKGRDFYAFPDNKGLYDRGFGVEYVNNKLFYITDHQLMPFKYVHEFQQILRLCGLNELADGFKIE